MSVSAKFMNENINKIFLCRKRSVLVSNVPAILGAAVSVLCVRFNMPELLMIGRFITGINCGTSVCLSVCLQLVGLAVVSTIIAYMLVVRLGTDVLRSVSTTQVHGPSSRAENSARELGCIF